MSEKYTIAIEVTGKDAGASNVLDGVGGSLKRVGEFVVGGLIVGGLQKIGSAFLNLGRDAISSVGNVQMLEKQIGSLLAQNLMYESQADGTFEKVMDFGKATQIAAAQTEDMLGFVQKLAIASSFGTADVEGVTKIAIATGMATDEVKAFTAAFMDVAAVKGIRDLEFAAGQFLQLKQRAALTTVDLRQLMGMGIDVSRIIGINLSGSLEEAEKRFGTLSPAARKVFGGMKLDIETFNKLAAESPEVLDAIYQKFILLGEEGAEGAAAEMALTVNGMMNSIGEVVEIGGRNLFRPIFEAVAPPIAEALREVQKFVTSDKLIGIGEAIGAQITKAIGAVETFFQLLAVFGDPLDAFKYAMFDLLPPETAQRVFDVVTKIQDALALLNTGDIAGAIGNLFGADAGDFAQGIIDTFAKISTFITEHSETIINVIIAIGMALAAGGIAAAFTAIGAAVTAAIPVIVTALGALLSPLALLIAFVALVAIAWTENWGGIRTAVEPIINWFIDAIKRLPETMETWKNNLVMLKNIVALIWANIKEKFAEAIDNIVEKIETGKENIVTAWENIKTAIAEKIEAIKTGIQEKIDAIQTAITEKFNAIKDGAIQIWENIKVGITNAVYSMFEAMGIDLDVFIAKWTQIWEDVKAIGTMVWDIIKEYVSGKIDEIIAKATQISESISEKWELIKNKATTVWENIKEYIALKWDEISTAVSERVTAISTAISEKWTEISTAVSEKWEEIKTAITTKWDEIKTAVEEKMAALVAIFAPKFDEAKLTVETKTGEIKTAAETKWEEIKNAISTKITEIIAAIKSKVSEFVQAGVDLITGIATGIAQGAGAVLTAITDAIANAIAGARAASEAHSPSRLTARVLGAPLAQGVSMGWLNEMTRLNALMSTALTGTIQNQSSITNNQNSFDLAVSVNSANEAQQVMDNFAFRRAWAG